MTVDDVKKHLSLYGVVVSAEDEEKLSYLYEYVYKKMLIRCNRTEFPVQAEPLILELICVYYNALMDGSLSLGSGVCGEVSSISLGDTSISFKSGGGSSVAVDSSEGGSLAALENRIVAMYRRLSW